MALLVRRLPQSALLLDAEHVVESNPGSEFVLGRDRADLVDRPWAGILAESRTDGTDSVTALRELMGESIARGATPPRRWRFRRPDGSTIEWELSLTAIEDGHELLALALIRDPSEWRQSEVPQGDAFRWEQLGKLSWGIAHDFNNMLTAIDGGLANAVADGASPAEARQGLTLARSCVRRAARLNRRLLDLSRDKRFSPRAVAIDPLLRETVRGLGPILGDGIEIVFEGAADGLSLTGDPEQLEQAIVNLAVNARDAMPDGGTLRIGTSEQVVDADFLERHPWARPGRYVRVDVGDSGIGIPYDLQARVFEPFFTSKAEGQGIGLGLSIVYGIVKQHRGFIDLDSRPGGGTRFWMLFPARPDARSGSRVVSDDSGGVIAGEGAAVLVVDDEEVVRELAVTALSGRGFRVLQAASAEEAQQTFDRNLGNIDVLVADLMLTGLGGYELSQRFISRKPDLQVVYTSGYDIAQLPLGVRPGEGSVFMQKPYTLRALAEQVEELLRKM